MTRRALLATLAVELPAPGEDAGPPEWVKLIPAGELDARDGRRWRHVDPGAVLAASQARARETDLVIDYEHQTDHAPDNGQPAPAAGWIRELTVRDGALWGRVEWTARAAAHIGAREYRYLSPTFAYDRETRHVRALHRAALTNSPAFDLPALARDSNHAGDAMTPEQLAALKAALGLPETASDEEVVAKARALGATPTLAPIATALGLAASATAEQIVAAAKDRAPNPGEFVPRAEFDRVADQLTTLQTERTEERATAAVDDAVAVGKVSPAQREWALGYARADASGFAAFVEKAPVVITPTRIGDGDQDRDPNAALTDDELAVCTAMGITAEQFKASRTELAERGEAR